MFDCHWTDPDKRLVGQRRAQQEVLREHEPADETQETQATLTRENTNNTTETNTENRDSVMRSPRSSGASIKGIAKFFKAVTRKKSKMNLGDCQQNNNNNNLSEGMRSTSLLSLSEESTANRAFIDSGSSIYSESSTTRPEKTSAETDDTSVIYNLEPSAHLAQRQEILSLREVLSESFPDDTSLCTIKPPRSHQSIETIRKASTTKKVNWPFIRTDSPVNFGPGYTTAPEAENAFAHFGPNNADRWQIAEEWEASDASARTSTSSIYPRTSSGISSSTSSVGSIVNSTYQLAIAPIISSAAPRSNSTQLPESHTVESVINEIDSIATEFVNDKMLMFRDKVGNMATARPEDIIHRLREIDSGYQTPGNHDSLDKEKHQWMLSVLHHIDHHGSNEPGYQRFASLTDSSDEHAPKLLCCFESGTTTEYISAIHPDKKVWHMSSDPLPISDTPSHINSILIPSGPATNFPFASQTFDFVYSISLSSKFCANEVPIILNKIANSLKPSGVMMFTLLDPLPVRSGPLLRRWLEDHLFMNLRAEGICTDPINMFTTWMGRLGLRGRGSLDKATSYYAVPESVYNPDLFTDELSVQKAILRSMTGHTLWLSVWGDFVTAESWWWEDPRIINECTSYGTQWKYHELECIKE